MKSTTTIAALGAALVALAETPAPAPVEAPAEASTEAPAELAAARPRPALTYSSGHRRRAHRQIAAARWYLRRHRATRPYRGWLARTRGCEVRGQARPYRTATGNGFWGAYQFTLSSWRAVGGRGMPHHAPPLEQDYRAVRLLHVQGAGAWPVCG